MIKGFLLILFALSVRAELPWMDVSTARFFFGPGGGSGVALSGKLAFLGGASVMNIYDVTAPSASSLRGSHPIPSPCLGIAVRGDRAYLALGAAGLQIVDIANPAAPQLVGSVDTPGSAQDVAAILGQIACVADGSAGAQVIDISNEAQPRIVRTFPTASPCDFILVDNSVAYAGASDALTILSLAALADPVLLGTAPLPSGSAINGLAKTGTHLLAACGTPGLIWFDVSDPSAPREAGRIEKNTAGVAAHNRLVFANHINEPRGIYDFTDPLDPRVVGTSAQGAGGKLAFSGNLLFASGLQSLLTVRVANPRFISQADTPGSAMKLRVANDLAYVADHAGLAIYDVASRASPTLLGQFPRATTLGVAAAADHALIGAADGLTIVNVSNPSSPTFVTNLPTPANIEDIVIENSRALVRSRSAIAIVDISNPAAPRQLGIYETPNSAMKVLPGGETIYVAEGSLVRVIDVRNPAAPASIGSFAGRAGTYAIALEGNYLYTANGISGLFVYDVSDLANVRLIARVWAGTSNGAWDVVVKDNLAYVARTSAGIAVLDISNPAAPREVGQNNKLTFVWGVHLAEGRLFAAGQGVGFGVFTEFRVPTDVLAIESVAFQSNGLFQFRLVGPPGARGTLQRAETLGQWSEDISFELGPGVVDFHEPIRGHNGFFRALTTQAK